jgi:hypothetical protein
VAGSQPSNPADTETSAPSVDKEQDTLPQSGGELAVLLPENSQGAEASGGQEGEEEDGEREWPVSSSDSKKNLTQKEALATDSLFKIAAAAAAEKTHNAKAPPEQPAAEAGEMPKPRLGWQIQIGAYPTKDGAMRIIEKALSMDLRPLAGKTAFAIPITRGSSTLYRARFSGFDQTSAQVACKELERKGLSCLPLAPQG